MRDSAPSMHQSRTARMLSKFSVGGEDEMGYVDDLTALPNRRFLDRAVDSLVRRCDPFSLFFVDLDRFKAVNDTLGHAEGDRVIQRFADLLLSSIRAEDMVGRYGGDEFVAIVAGDDETATAAIAARIVRAAATSLKPLWSVSASLGVARFPSDARTKPELLAMADRAMYAAKAGGRSCWRHARAEGTPLFWHEDVCVGRQRDLAWLVQRSFPADASKMTIVAGEAGVGKVTLLERALSSLPDGVRVLRMDCPTELATVPYASLVTMLREGCARFGLPPLPEAWSRVLSAMMPDVFSGGDPTPQRFERVVILQAMSSLLQGWAPLTIAIPRGHHLDRETAEFLRYLLRVGMPMHLAVCCTIDGEGEANSQGAAEMLAGITGAVVRELPPLRPEEVRDLIAQRLGMTPVSQDLAEALFDASGGNALIANEILRALLDMGDITSEGVSAVRDAMPGLLSDRVRRLAEDTLASLAEDERTILLNAAVVESKFDLHMLRTLTGRGEGEILTCLDRARRRGIVRGSTADSFTFAFANGIFRDEVLRTADPASLRQAHLAMADLLKSTDRHGARARHLEEGGEWLAAVWAYMEAARQSAVRLLPPVALHYLTLAERIRERLPIDTLPASEVEALLRELASSFYHCNLPDESRAVHLRLAASCAARGDHGLADSHRRVAAIMLRIAGRHAQALSELEALSPEPGGSLVPAVAMARADVLTRLGRTQEADQVLRRVRARVRDAAGSDPRTYHEYLHTRTLVASARCAFITAKREAMKAVRVAGDSPDLWWSFNDLAEICLFTGELRQAVRHFTHARALAAAVPSIMGEIWTRLGIVGCDYYLARPLQALGALDDAEELIRKADDSAALLNALFQRTRLHLDLGELDAAEASVKRVRNLELRRDVLDHSASLCALAAGSWNDALSLATSALHATRTATPPLALSGMGVVEVDLDLHRETLLALMGDSRGVWDRVAPRADSLYPRARLRAKGLLAHCAHLEGDDETAERLYREALTARYGRQEAREREQLVKAWSAWSPHARPYAAVSVHRPKNAAGGSSGPIAPSLHAEASRSTGAGNGEGVRGAGA